jgi:drug/metabolite transporter (DMT)-like permease
MVRGDVPSHTGAKTIACTAFALAGFAANSLLTRAAVGPGAIDAVAFSGVRLLTGALALTVIALLIRAPRPDDERGAPWTAWRGALALAAYAYAFAFAYERIDAGVGALILFGAVQLTMTAWGMWQGERPRTLEWAGLGAAAVGLVVLVRPGLTAPDPIGALLMALAGSSWGVYSLLGRAAGSPLARTAANFVRAAAIGVVLLALAWPLLATPAGLGYATASGALASGAGYTLWYMALPGLTRFRAAVVQLAVPAVTGLAAWPLLDEPLTGRLAGSAVLVLGGILVACLARPLR